MGDEPEHHSRQEDRCRKQSDLDGTVGPFALHLACSRIHENLLDFNPEPVGPHPHGKQQVQEGHGGILRLDARDPLLVTADVLPHSPSNLRFHDRLCLLEAIRKLDLVTLGF